MLAQVFDDAGFEPFMPASRLGYRFETPGQNEKNARNLLRAVPPAWGSDLLGMWVSARRRDVAVRDVF